MALGYLASAGYSFGLVLMLAPCKYFLVKKKKKNEGVRGEAALRHLLKHPNLFFFFFSQDLITKAWNRIRAMHKQDATQSKLNLAGNVKW